MCEFSDEALTGVMARINARAADTGSDMQGGMVREAPIESDRTTNGYR